ncbi:TetR/AcrR family transcriptional regulator [Noviherbaspirillum denitrificans]|uniref:TetR family transcriptional regulator n=1 Tax=Noviherbaspirillum denitrificans TaxID=1968433 RepID=A0A254TGU0_9BURK|nr:TetR/AcrR family transcriptional regulator [Noviherbaspirillum denitrificans]OWW21850.1 TetR family transcriptional regulator [Noviherbaspirillum denitrificans]
MDTSTTSPRRRGRPPKDAAGSYAETRSLLVSTGLAVLTEKGYSSVGIDEILRMVGVPKGSFYHYFSSKEAFGQVLIAAYADYFARKLDRCFLDTSRTPLQRLRYFVQDAKQGMAKHGFRRGCLVGNLGQEMAVLPESFRHQLADVFRDWQQRTERCLKEAQQTGEIGQALDCAQLAEFFWIGWEGAVLRAKLEQQAVALDIFANGFFKLVEQRGR